jgi:DNA modification methylase
VFDPFLGTGTTIDAAIQLQRFGVGCEEDMECCRAINTRLWNTIEKIVKQSKLLIYHQNKPIKLNQIIQSQIK